ncbi:MAG: hypothetical protein HC844_13180 [Tabrizicola sp.]|nr:hypothetical protein [Tabrizicola sp.]
MTELPQNDVAGPLTPESWAEHVAHQEIVVAMRFSYFGRSGWQGAASRDKALLFDADRLMLRLSLLESLALPSLAAQTDQHFHLHVLCGWAMPVWAKTALREACASVLPEDRFTVDPQPWGIAQVNLGKFLCRRYGTGRVLQTVLDDDDGLSTDFLATMRQEMAGLPPPAVATDLRFVSFARGFGLDVTDLSTSAITLFALRYPFINLGLSLSAPADGVNIFAIAHRKGPPKHPHVLRRGNRMYVRTIHVRNDSRLAMGQRWEALPDWRDDPEIAERFPWLLRL